MLAAQAGFSTAFATIFQPMAGESGLSTAHPESASTLREIAGYQDLMAELRDAVQPELDLIDTRVTAPLKEYQELLKKIRKTITKRDHKVSEVRERGRRGADARVCSWSITIGITTRTRSSRTRRRSRSVTRRTCSSMSRTSRWRRKSMSITTSSFSSSALRVP
jgi:hypothetical protein